MNVKFWQKALTLTLSVVFILSCAACGNSGEKASKGNKKKQHSSKASEIASSEDNSSNFFQADSTSSAYDNVNYDDENNNEENDSKLKIRKLSIDNRIAVQENYLGFSAISQGFMYMPDPYGREYTEKQKNLFLERIKKTGVKMVRSYFDQGYAAVKNSDGTFAKDSNGKLVWNWESDEMQGLYSWLQAMKDLDITVMLNMSWNTAVLMQETSYGLSNPFYGMTVDEVTEAYSNWVNDSLKQIIDVKGFTNVKYAVIFTEPYSRATLTGRKVSEITDSDRNTPGGTLRQTDWYVDMIKVLDTTLKNDSMRNKIKLVGPNVVLRDDIANLDEEVSLAERMEWWISKLNAYIDVYSFHWYAPAYPGVVTTENDLYVDSSVLQSDYLSEITPLLRATGKEFWFDELNYVWNDGVTYLHDNVDQGWSGTQLAQLAIANMNSGIQNNLLWSYDDIQWPLKTATRGEYYKGIHITGIQPSLNDASTPYKQFYAYTLFSKYMTGDEGTKVYSGEGKKGIYTTMVKFPDGNISVAVVNTNLSAQAFRIDFKEALSGNGIAINRHLYNPETVKPTSNANIIAKDKIFTSVKDKIQDVLPAGAVAIYTTID